MNLKSKKQLAMQQRNKKSTKELKTAVASVFQQKNLWFKSSFNISLLSFTLYISKNVLTFCARFSFIFIFKLCWLDGKQNPSCSCLGALFLSRQQIISPVTRR